MQTKPEPAQKISTDLTVSDPTVEIVTKRKLTVLLIFHQFIRNTAHERFYFYGHRKKYVKPNFLVSSNVGTTKSLFINMNSIDSL
jgi:hypothetical protein